jgi:cytochrome c oxidase cbb3-type subunit I/II
VFGKPVILVLVAGTFFGGFLVMNAIASLAFVAIGVVVALFGTMALQLGKGEGEGWHRLVEGRAVLFTVLTVLSVLFGGVAEILPSLLAEPEKSTVAGAKPYQALELEGRDVYLRVGCYNCHSQMIRPFRWEQQRYGEPSTLAESQFDHPFQWGSKRTGPDLAREGGKYPNLWHYQHFVDPRSISEGSNMPPYAHLAKNTIDLAATPAKLRAHKSIGVPYSPEAIAGATNEARTQAESIAKDLAESGVTVEPNTEMVALIAYMQRLGQTPAEPAPKSATVAQAH